MHIGWLILLRWMCIKSFVRYVFNWDPLMILHAKSAAWRSGSGCHMRDALLSQGHARHVLHLTRSIAAHAGRVNLVVLGVCMTSVYAEVR